MHGLSKRIIIGIVAVLATGAVVYTGAMAADIEFDDWNEPSLAGEATFPQDQAIEAARNAVPGDVIEVEVEKVANKIVYEIDIRPSAGGPDMEVIVDGVSGAVLSTVED